MGNQNEIPDNRLNSINNVSICSAEVDIKKIQEDRKLIQNKYINLFSRELGTLLKYF